MIPKEVLTGIGLGHRKTNTCNFTKWTDKSFLLFGGEVENRFCMFKRINLQFIILLTTKFKRWQQLSIGVQLT